MPKEYFGYWNRTYGDWKNTEIVFGQTSLASKQSDAHHCGDTSVMGWRQDRSRDRRVLHRPSELEGPATPDIEGRPFLCR
jgi:hypothetical protein